MVWPVTGFTLFQSTLPVWGATGSKPGRICNHMDFNPRSPCGERLGNGSPFVCSFISIHAPRVGSDFTLNSLCTTAWDFNPRSPCGERPPRQCPRTCNSHFNPRSPCGERHILVHLPRNLNDFNPRSPCGERQSAFNNMAEDTRKFQSTLPVWGATVRRTANFPQQFISIHAPRVGSDVPSLRDVRRLEISIHAPRVGSDFAVSSADSLSYDFNPRSPCGERHTHPGSCMPSGEHFNPRSPCGERRDRDSASCSTRRFQSTLPVWGATFPVCSVLRCKGDFNPRSPCGERQFATQLSFDQQSISIHAPRVGSDSKTAQILLEILSHLNSFAPSEKKKIPFHRKEQGKFIEIF